MAYRTSKWVDIFPWFIRNLNQTMPFTDWIHGFLGGIPPIVMIWYWKMVPPNSTAVNGVYSSRLDITQKKTNKWEQNCSVLVVLGYHLQSLNDLAGLNDIQLQHLIWMLHQPNHRKTHRKMLPAGTPVGTMINAERWLVGCVYWNIYLSEKYI